MQPLPNSSSRRSKEVIGPESYTCGAPVVGGRGRGGEEAARIKGCLKLHTVLHYGTSDELPGNDRTDGGVEIH